jgi:hypothetical protein
LEQILEHSEQPRIRQLAAAAGELLPRLVRPARDALIVVGVGRALWYFFVQDIQPWTFLGVDARAYWRVDLAHPYAHAQLGEVSSYLYSPAFAQAISPLWILPFPVFFALWTLVSAVILVWLVRPWPWAAVILCLPIIYELCVGNIHFFLAAVAVLAFRAPWAWALPLLTKITPGIGLAWFGFRREWRNLAIGVGATAAIVAVSFVLNPSAWLEWFAYLGGSSGNAQYLPFRVAAALVLVAISARADRPWLVPIAVWLAMPAVYVNSWVVLLAVVRLAPEARSPRADAAPLQAGTHRGRAHVAGEDRG